MSLHLWEAIHDADVRSRPIFDIDPDLVESQPPSLQRVLLAAATLWCRHLVWPTVREIGSLAAVAPSTSINAVGSSAGLRRLLVDAETSTELNLFHRRLEREGTPQSVLDAIAERTSRLAAIDPALRRLPLLVAFVHGRPSAQLVIASVFSTSLATDTPLVPAVA